LIYSGGVGSLDDLVALRELRAGSLTGVIVGRALYEQRFGVGDAVAALRG
jgi:phosphoribosylformimino-5-aminoimidazole carboxamide ribotide isomerase